MFGYAYIFPPILFVWPIIVTFCCLVIKRQEMTSKVNFFFSSLLVGYISIIAALMLVGILSDIIPPVIQILLCLLPPVISSYNLASESEKHVKLEKKESINLLSLPIIQIKEIPTESKFHASLLVDENGMQVKHKAYLEEIGNELILTIVINHDDTYRLYEKKKFKNTRDLGEYLKQSTKFLLTDFS